MARSFHLVLFIFLSLHLHAQTISWIAQDGVWKDRQNWSTGEVPDETDDVYISPNAVVTIENGDWEARSVRISQNASLIISSHAHLRVSNNNNSGSTFDNYGYVVVDGRLDVRHDDENNTSQGINNRNQLAISQGGSIHLYQNNFGIWNTGLINIRGEIYGDGNYVMIKQRAAGNMIIHGTGFLHARRIGLRVITMESGTSATNAGRIEIADQLEGVGINPAGYFENMPGGDIWIQSANSSAISVSGSSGQFVNHGKIRLTGSDFLGKGIAIGAGGQFLNASQGTIEANGIVFPFGGIALNNNSSLVNEGRISLNMLNHHIGVSINNSEFINYGTLEVEGNVSTSIRLTNNGQFFNNGGIVELHGSESLDISGVFSNDHCGVLKTRSKIFLDTNAGLRNRGYWEHYSGSVSLDHSSHLENEAVIYDPSDEFMSLSGNSFSNNGVVLGRQNYIPEEGEFYEEVFDLAEADWGEIDAQWTTSPNSNTSVSNYYYPDNVLEFYDLSSEIEDLYAEIRIYGCQNRTYRIPFAQAANRQAGSSLGIDVDNRSSAQQETIVYPNPVQSVFNVRFSSALKSPSHIQLFDLGGRQISQWSIAAQTGQLQLDRPKNTVAGIYLLHLIHANGEVERQRLVFE